MVYKARVDEILVQWVLQIRDSSFFQEKGQIREIGGFPYLPFLGSNVK